MPFVKEMLPQQIHEGIKIGAHIKNQECVFSVWAPFRKKVEVKITAPRAGIYPMTKDALGYWQATVKDVGPRVRYMYVLDGLLERPDPASFFQPQGVHGPSQIIRHGDFPWQDQAWRNIVLEQMIIYEIHTGTFTPEGTFKAAVGRLGDLCDLGINAVEIMPVAQFPGQRNWGYDGVYSFAVQESYGGPDGLKTFVDACHAAGLAVILDVVYNHFGPEGNYLNDFGPYFTDKYVTSWGRAVNFDDADNGGARHFFFENALYWLEHFHIDGLRLDAVHAIKDDSAKPFLKELKEKTEEWSRKSGKKVYLIAESDLNDVRLVERPERGGFGLDAQWSDDFHHAVHALLTGEDSGYYQDFGNTAHLKKALEESFVYSWDYSAFRRRRHGSCARGIPAGRFVVSLQNHDQVGNRVFGERLSRLVSLDGQRAAAAVLLLSPYIPLIFMGEEYAEETPFYYFVDHSDAGLIEAVRKGRKAEFSSFRWKGEPPDPQDERTYLESKICWADRSNGPQQKTLGYWKKLIRMRKEFPALKGCDRTQMEVEMIEDQKTIYFRRWSQSGQAVVIANFSSQERPVPVRAPGGPWKKVLDSADQQWGGPAGISMESRDFNAPVVLGPLNSVVFVKEVLA